MLVDSRFGDLLGVCPRANFVGNLAACGIHVDVRGVRSEGEGCEIEPVCLAQVVVHGVQETVSVPHLDQVLVVFEGKCPLSCRLAIGGLAQSRRAQYWCCHSCCSYCRLQRERIHVQVLMASQP